ncbi:MULTISPECIES: cupin domain-containing protein [unclassified Roseovarius]|uniref:cupin domain-containing protein n=1 Tax=unclassified Roseovarius TaxID=2614913 RepID=UPI00273D3FC9|nr:MULTISPECIES: cupin domain-containing protein [unclassified Roseovarius]
MKSRQRIVRLSPNGPDGLDPMTLDPADFATPPEAQNVHVYFQDDELGLSVGVWDTTTMQEAFGPYPGDEFIVVLEGHFRMLDADGDGVPAQQGQSVIFRNGAPVSWKQDGYLKKFYITYLDPRAPTPAVECANGGIIALDPDQTLTDADLLTDTRTPQREKVFFTNDHRNFEVGLWDTQTLQTEMAPFESHEFCQVLDGEVTLTEDNGTAHHFKTGDVFFVPAGTVCAWNVPAYLRKYYATLDPSIRPGG